MSKSCSNCWNRSNQSVQSAQRVQTVQSFQSPMGSRWSKWSECSNGREIPSCAKYQYVCFWNSNSLSCLRSQKLHILMLLLLLMMLLILLLLWLLSQPQLNFNLTQLSWVWHENGFAHHHPEISFQISDRGGDRVPKGGNSAVRSWHVNLTKLSWVWHENGFSHPPPYPTIHPNSYSITRSHQPLMLPKQQFQH